MSERIKWKIPEHSTFPSRLKKLANERPNKEAFVFYSPDLKRRAFTRQEVWENSCKFAAMLKSKGLKKGDIVCNNLVNSPERLFTAYGSQVAGCISMHGQVLLADGEDLLMSLRNSRCKAIVLDPTDEAGASRILDKISSIDQNTGRKRYKGLPDLEITIEAPVKVGSLKNMQPKRFLEVLEACEDMYEDTSVLETDVAWILATSGTTGFSKLVQQTHRSFLIFGMCFGQTAGATDENSVYYNDRSLGWGGGAPTIYPTVGCARVLTDQAYGLPTNMGFHAWELINLEKCDSGFIVPYHVEQILTYSESISTNYQMKTIGIGGCPLTKFCLEAIGKITHKIIVLYGSTECGIVSAKVINKKDDYENYSVGVPCEGGEVKVVNDQHQTVDEGQTGYIFIKNPMTSIGYLNDEEKNENTFFGEWAWIGDVGCSKNGDLYIFDRESNAIMRGAFIVYPGWLEMGIKKLPGVEDVVVVGVPDDKNHNELCACVIRVPGTSLSETELQDQCKTLFVSNDNSETSLIPKHFLFVESYPTNANGKIIRSQVKEYAIKTLNISEWKNK